MILPVEQNKDPTPYTLLTLFNEEGGDVWTPTHVDNFPTLLFGFPNCVFSKSQASGGTMSHGILQQNEQNEHKSCKTGDLIMWSIHPHVLWCVLAHVGIHPNVGLSSISMQWR